MEMVNLKRSVGYVQISLGIMLIFACLVGYDLLTEQATKNYDSTDYTLQRALGNLGVTQSEQQMVTSLQIRAYSSITTRFVMQSFMITIFLLAVMMILQGVANTRTGNKDDIPPKELGRFITTMFIIIYVIASAYIIIFKSPGGERAINALYLIIILVVTLAIIRLFRNIHRNPEKKKR